MRKSAILAAIATIGLAFGGVSATAQDNWPTYVQESDADNFQRVKVTAQIDDDLHAVYGCLKSTGRQAENAKSIFGSDSFFDNAMWSFLPGGTKAELRKLELVKDDAYCAMIVARTRSKKSGNLRKRVKRHIVGDLVIMTFDSQGKKKDVLTSTTFCPNISKTKLCYKTAKSGVVFTEGKFYYKGAEVSDGENVVSGVAGCFSFVNKKTAQTKSTVVYLGKVPEAISGQVDTQNNWTSVSTKTCVQRGFRKSDT